jgi:uncharacterized protein (TIGR02453 family)
MTAFNGFSKELPKFFQNLKKNNTKPWFEKHRNEYEEFVLGPAREFVVEMGTRLRKIAPEINAIPKINQSLFKINRDVRFSKDKSPYKTSMGIWFWEGRRKRMECSGFYFHLEDQRMFFGMGICASAWNVQVFIFILKISECSLAWAYICFPKICWRFTEMRWWKRSLDRNSKEL